MIGSHTERDSNDAVSSPRHTRTAIAVGALACGVVAMILAGAGLAQAASGHVDPAVHEGGNSFYPEAQIDSEWNVVTQNYTAALPAGISFPSNAPAFFHPDDGDIHIFQTGLPELIAARFWRCAWLDTSLKATGAHEQTTLAVATKALSNYANLPGVKDVVNTEEYEASITAYAKSQKLDPTEAEFNIDCAVYAEGKDKK